MIKEKHMQKSNTNFITCFKNLVLNTPIIPFFKYFGISSVKKHTVEVLDLAKISTGTMWDIGIVWLI